ncbi:LADA_0B11650g1_1 [Lachancea dasiensis]|uniref:LADA_0B11650g1_1 n=1 Tax=Lachancea dasiensis TaxID=1072105 RepID=A0A1G4IW04_9SACH|nr:LADA_0B11650g1_1 [Lachancea dasiensis]
MNAQQQFDRLKKIQTSPHSDHEHSLALSSLALNYQIVSWALQSLAPVTADKYAFQSYAEVFNISRIVELIKQKSENSQYKFPETKVYIIAIRSALLKEVQDSCEKLEFLTGIDKMSHMEANSSGGLIIIGLVFLTKSMAKIWPHVGG